MRTLLCCLMLALAVLTPALANDTAPLRATVDMDIGETRTVTLHDGKSAEVTLLSVLETRDRFRKAVRSAEVRVRVNGTEITLPSGNYTLPVTAAGVRIDCPVTGGYNSNASSDFWGLEKDARLRLWPEGSPLMSPGTFGYPVRQAWFASHTQMGNEPCHVDASDVPERQAVYYHNGLDFGGAEGMVDVLAATDGLVVSIAGRTLEGHEKDTPVAARYDVIYVFDDRGWYYRYSHLKSFETNIRLGERVRVGQKVGELGKEGGSGGWSHFHFGVSARQPSGKWGSEDAYAYCWEAYANLHKPALVAVARPHHLAALGDTVALDGGRSVCLTGKIAEYRWTFSDGSTGRGPVQPRVYTRPGTYSEVLKVTGTTGAVDYDFATVTVVDPLHPDRLPPTIHAAYSPTFGIRAGDPVTFKVRTFRAGPGEETWDFGDGSPAVRSSSNPVDQHAPDGYAVLTHRFPKPGRYLVRVTRSNEVGPATTHLDVTVE